jgi:hypothetical protein
MAVEATTVQRPTRRARQDAVFVVCRRAGADLDRQVGLPFISGLYQISCPGRLSKNLCCRAVESPYPAWFGGGVQQTFDNVSAMKDAVRATAPTRGRRRPHM